MTNRHRAQNGAVVALFALLLVAVSCVPAPAKLTSGADGLADLALDGLAADTQDMTGQVEDERDGALPSGETSSLDLGETDGAGLDTGGLGDGFESDWATPKDVDGVADLATPDVGANDGDVGSNDGEVVTNGCADDEIGVPTYTHPAISVLKPGQSLPALFLCAPEIGSDVDWFAVTIDAIGQYRFRVSYNAVINTAYHLDLYKPGVNGTINVSQPLASKFDYGLGANVLVTTLPSGLYYLRVSFETKDPAAVGKYSLDVLDPCTIDADCKEVIDAPYCDNQHCVACRTNDHCILSNPKTPVCDSGICKECATDQHCVDTKNEYGKVCTDKIKGKCGCTTNNDCNPFGDRPICREILGVTRCVPCEQDDECRGLSTTAMWVCLSGRCGECRDDFDCAWDPSKNPGGNKHSLGRVCDTALNQCGCGGDWDCWNIVDGTDQGHPHGSICDSILKICVCKDASNCTHKNADGPKCVAQPIGIGGQTNIPFCSP